MAKILIIEDYFPLAKSLMNLLGKHHETYAAPTLLEARHKISLYTFDLIIIDRGLPDGDGLDLVPFLHDHHFFTHTLILSQKNATPEIIEGLQIGADDYLTKPFDYEELFLRITKLLSTYKIRQEKILQCGQLTLNVTHRTLRVASENSDIALQQRETDILAFFLERINHIVSREDLLQNIWSDRLGKRIDLRTIDVYLRRLRLRLGAASSQLQSVRGVGYRLTA